MVMSDYLPVKISQEQFERAEKAAHRIARGESPGDIFNGEDSDDSGYNGGVNNA
jgi:hypothetical protein